MTKIALAQLNFTVGDISGNTEKIIAAASHAREHGAHLLLLPELALTGYPLEDLLHRDDIYDQIDAALNKIKQTTQDIDILLTYPEKDKMGRFNTAAWIRNGEVITKYHKRKLPNYGVFDEVRYFQPGTETAIVDFQRARYGLLICEDIWFQEPALETKAAGADYLICLNASPYSMNKQEMRLAILKKRAEETGLPIFFINLVGGQDELVFDGSSLVIDSNGDIVALASAFKEEILYVEINQDKKIVPQNLSKPSSKLATIYDALTLGIKDYVQKNHFPGVVIGLSGGIDSALTLALAVDALGADQVEAVFMPSRYSADLSATAAQEQAEFLGVKFHIIPIQSIFEKFLATLDPIFNGTPADVTEENIQARIRGTFLMALSNKTGKMVLSTGNKSETGVGYATLYGDMVGGFDALKDISKTLVYELSRYRNMLAPVIPQAVIDRAPSAELAENQQDQDSLPPYDVLDRILEEFVEKDRSYNDIIKMGFDKETTKKVIQMVLRNEYKRRQAPPGVRITEKAFGRDRRYPITSAYLPWKV